MLYLWAVLFDDSYLVPEKEGNATLRERSSRFIAYAYRVQNEAQIKEHLQALRQQYPDATHICYAWVLHPDKHAQRANDDGEPANSAGKPILRQIAAAGLTNCLVAVVRYFGGKMLGIPGLIEAYGSAAKLAIAQAGTQKIAIEALFAIVYDYAFENEAYRLAKTTHATVKSHERKEKGLLQVAVALADVAAFELKAADFHMLEIKKLA